MQVCTLECSIAFTQGPGTCMYVIYYSTTIKTKVETPMLISVRLWRQEASTASKTYYKKMTTAKVINLATLFLLLVSGPGMT